MNAFVEGHKDLKAAMTSRGWSSWMKPNKSDAGLRSVQGFKKHVGFRTLEVSMGPDREDPGT